LNLPNLLKTQKDIVLLETKKKTPFCLLFMLRGMGTQETMYGDTPETEGEPLLARGMPIILGNNK